jgi:acetate kinase
LILIRGGVLFTKASTIRTLTCNGLGFLGIELNEKRNAANAGVVSTDSSRVPPRIIRTDQEHMIAETVCRVLSLNEKREN